MMTETAYAEHVMKWIELGATLVGGCCGTSPSHIREIAARLEMEKPKAQPQGPFEKPT